MRKVIGMVRKLSRKEYHKRYSKRYYQEHKTHLDKLSKIWVDAHKHTKDFKKRTALANKKAYNKRYQVVYKLKSKPCKDCKRRFPPCCMDFHHVRGKKRFEIGDRVCNLPFSRLQKEIKKCEVICANCHRIRTYKK